MVNDGLEIARNEHLDINKKLNRKTLFVGNPTQIDALSPTTPGQLVFPTSTGSGLIVDELYTRNTANTTWKPVNIIETAELNSTPTAATLTSSAISNTLKYYDFFTLPTTDIFYIIVGIEWKNGGTVAGSVLCGVEAVDANPPIIQYTPLLALSQVVTATGINSLQRVSNIASKPIRGGTVCGVFFSGQNNSQTIQEETGLTSQNSRKSTSYFASPSYQDTTAWTASGTRRYLKAYYRGYP